MAKLVFFGSGSALIWRVASSGGAPTLVQWTEFYNGGWLGDGVAVAVDWRPCLSSFFFSLKFKPIKSIW